jgi:hypothetical protein
MKENLGERIKNLEEGFGKLVSDLAKQCGVTDELTKETNKHWEKILALVVALDGIVDLVRDRFGGELNKSLDELMTAMWKVVDPSKVKPA